MAAGGGGGGGGVDFLDPEAFPPLSPLLSTGVEAFDAVLLPDVGLVDAAAAGFCLGAAAAGFGGGGALAVFFLTMIGWSSSLSSELPTGRSAGGLSESSSDELSTRGGTPAGRFQDQAGNRSY